MNRRSKHFLYHRWHRMKRRCLDPKCSDWKYYGARGIAVCDRWLDFEKFCDDMAATYRDGLTIDRIDGNGPYSPENCRWATRAQQTENSRHNGRRPPKLLTFNGQTYSMGEWAKRLGLKNQSTITNRLSAGWPLEKILSTPALVTWIRQRL